MLLKIVSSIWFICYESLFTFGNAVEVFLTALMIYTKDESKPLPTQEEILICNEHTTAEEVVLTWNVYFVLSWILTIQVILLWQRAIFDPDYKRIFCIIHGEKLSYSACEQALKGLNRLKQGRSGNLL